MLHSSGAGVVVVGASVAGLHAAEALRDAGHDGPVTVLDAEPEPLCDRPPLSKQLLTGEWTREQALLRDAAALAARGIDVRHGVRATGLDPRGATVHTTDGPLPYAGLVIATGAAARPLPGTGELPGLYTLRTLADCLALRDDLERGAELVVVGAGFVGMEVAAAARGLGAAVTVVDPLPAPMAAVLGPDVGEAVRRVHAERGVAFRLGCGVRAVRGASRVEAVELDDGTVLQADAVLVGIGAVPVTGWLEGAELDLSSGLMCDEYLGVGPPGIVAAGDVANWFNPRYGERMRIEHWTTAVEQGGIAARNLLAPAGEGAPADLVPYFWSDQYDLRIQFAGRVGDDVRTVRAGDGQRPSVLALSGRGGLLTGVLSVEADRAFVRARRMLRGTVRLEEAEAITRELLGGGGRDRTRPAQQRPSAPSIS